MVVHVGRKMTVSENFAVKTNLVINYLIIYQSEAKDLHAKVDFWLGIRMSIHLEKITPLFDSDVDRHVEGQDWHANRALMDVRFPSPISIIYTFTVLSICNLLIFYLSYSFHLYFLLSPFRLHKCIQLIFI